MKAIAEIPGFPLEAPSEYTLSLSFNTLPLQLQKIV
jgi:hypothetical protein